ncbi:uncharacterized protein HMPREF1541_07684 [Cyphellophora europaea CBS 101466]|uniref:Transcription factor domain-containing protein n=1 Tax=Cyphellophora europaea (strain CBS 101466) TaxID=1220924 RepID=W2RP09_CYPE1|nr:uncharacterized protein HMPREF1541_07684 [Cyphellophora europaea CBS 101466]ETN38060.1 hypothetical protein HMPREF1541_07684 [Cyphellophora europaea CBS 101466]
MLSPVTTAPDKALRQSEQMPKPEDVFEDEAMTVLPLTPVPTDLGCALTDHAFLISRRDYLDSPSCPDNGIWSFLGKQGFVWGPYQPGTCFNLAAMAVSLAAYGIRENRPDVMEQGRRKYADALMETRAELCSPVVEPTDELLMTCLLLSAYEVSRIVNAWFIDIDHPQDQVCNFDSNIDTYKTFSEGSRHQEGAMALLRMRTLSPVKNDRSLLIDKYIRRQLLRSNLYRALPLPEWLEDGSLFGEVGHELELDRHLIQTINIRHDVLSLFKHIKSMSASDSHRVTSALFRSIRDCRDCDIALQAWSTTAPPEYDYQTIKIDIPPYKPKRENIFYSTTSHAYNDRMCAISWNRYRGARLVVNGLLHRAIVCAITIAHPDQTLGSISLPGYIDNKETILGLVDDICASVPYHFGATKATIPSYELDEDTATRIYPLACPLLLASGALFVPGDQREWIKMILGLIGRITDSTLLMAATKLDLQDQSCLLKYDAKPEKGPTP